MRTLLTLIIIVVAPFMGPASQADKNVVARFIGHEDKTKPPSHKDTAALIQALDSPDTNTATNAVISLLHHVKALGAGPVRLACAASARLHLRDAAPSLAWIVTTETVDAPTRAICALALGKLTIISSLPPGGGGSGRGGKGEREHKPEIETKAPDEGVEALLHTLTPSSTPLIVRAASARALGFTFDEKALKPLKDIRDDHKEDPILRFMASWSYCRIGTYLEDIISQSEGEKKVVARFIGHRDLQKKGWDGSCGAEDLTDKAGEAFTARFGDLAGLAGVLP